MAESTTLRALAGLSVAPPSLADSTLIMIDCQNTYTRGVMELEGVPGSLYDTDGESGAIVARVAPRDGETVVAAATATRALPGSGGTTVSATAMQAASLAALADLFAVVVPGAAAIPD